MKAKTMTATIKQAVKASGRSNYLIAKETGIDAAALGRFLSGKQSLRLDLADKLAAYLGIECRIVKGR